MSKFYKKLSKYTKSYSKKINEFHFTDEEKVVFLTIGHSIINSLIYFVGGLKESSSDYTGFKVKSWSTKLRDIEEKNIHHILIEITHEYLETTLNTSTTILDKEKLKEWHHSFLRFADGMNPEHLVDRVFPNLFLEEAKRNDMPVMTFVTIVDNMFFRLDTTIERAISALVESNSKSS